MQYNRQVLNNIKNFTPIFSLIGVFVALIISFTFFQNTVLPSVLKHNLLLIYLFLLLFVFVLTILVCLVLPLELPTKFKNVLQTISQTSKSINIAIAPFVYSIVLLVTIGIVTVYSSSYYYSTLIFDNPNTIINNHMIQLLIGIFIILILIIIKYKSSFKFVNQVILPSIIVIIGSLLLFDKQFIYNIGIERIVSNPNLYFDLSKIFLIFYLASIFNKNKTDIVLFIPIILIVIPTFFLNNTENIPVIILILTMVIIISIGRYNIKYATKLLFLIQLIFIIIISIPLIKLGYQLGGVFGLGLGNGITKFELGYEAFTYNIFQILIEETGLVGAIIVLLLILTISLSVTKYIIKMQRYNGLLCLGCLCAIGIQFILSIGSSINFIPLHKLSVPYISYGIYKFDTIINLFIFGIMIVELLELKNIHK